MNLSPNPAYLRQYIQRLRAGKVGLKEKILKNHDYLALNNALGNRVGENAFFEENENKMK